MQVTQTLSQGLKQEFTVVLPAGELATKLDSQLAEMRAKAQLKGFRPGKAPLSYLKKVYGKGLMSEVLQEAVNEANRKIVEEHKLRIAIEPKLDFPGGQSEVERALQADGDFSYVVTFETLPAIVIGSFDDISLLRPVAPVSDADIAAAIDKLAERAREYEPRGQVSEEGVEGEEGQEGQEGQEGEQPGQEGQVSATAQKGDKVTLDFTGTLDGVAFEGGTGGDVDIVLGSGSFIPGFEEQLLGAAAGERRLVKVRFPDNYSAKNLAGHDAEFDVEVKAVASPKAQKIDEAFAKKYGFGSLADFQTAVRGNLEADHDKASRDKLKRALLDALDRKYSFELPESLVEQEFSSIWEQLEAESKRGPGDAAGRPEEEKRVEYRAIAERRVRLGLVLAEIGQSAGVTVEDDDVTKALTEHVRQFPGQERQVWDFYINNAQALAQIRAPLYEERVVDHIATLIQIVDKTVSRDELFAEEEDAPAASAAAEADAFAS